MRISRSAGVALPAPLLSLTSTVGGQVRRYVDRDGLPLRAVVCVSAYKKLAGLHDLNMFVATVDDARMGVLGRFDVLGVTFDNALRLARHYLDAFGRGGP